MELIIEVAEDTYRKALRYTLDPAAHLASMIEHWAQMAEQKNPGVDVLTLPTLAELAAEQEAQVERERQELAHRREAIEQVIATAPQEIQDALRQRLSDPSATLDAATAALAEAVQQRQKEIERAAKQAEDEAKVKQQLVKQTADAVIAALKADPNALAKLLGNQPADAPADPGPAPSPAEKDQGGNGNGDANANANANAKKVERT